MVIVQTLFCFSLAMAKSIGELQVLSPHVAFKGPVLSQLCLPDFIVQTQFRCIPSLFVPGYLLDGV